MALRSRSLANNPSVKVTDGGSSKCFVPGICDRCVCKKNVLPWLTFFFCKAKMILVRSRVVEYFPSADFPSSYASEPEPHQCAYCLHVLRRKLPTFHAVIDYPVALWAVHRLGGIVT